MLTAQNSYQTLLPGDPVGSEFCRIFNYGWQVIIARNEGSKISWFTETRYPMKPRALWEIWNDPDRLIGVRFGKETQYGMLDIDRNSPYHPYNDERQFWEALRTLETIGLCRYILVRSSYSEGLHVYFPLEQPVSSYGLALAMRVALEQAGLEVKGGHLETFPNVKTYSTDGFTSYNAHRLPLQPKSGSFILNKDLGVTLYEVEGFLAQWRLCAAANDLQQLQRAIVKAKNQKRVVELRPGTSSSGSERLRQWQQDNEDVIQQGWTGDGQTNELLKTIACHGVVFMHLSGWELEEYVYQTATSAPGYEEHCNHKHNIRERVRDWAQEAAKYWWGAGTTPKREQVEARTKKRPEDQGYNEHNLAKQDEAYTRIVEALEELTQSGELAEGVSARLTQLAKVAKTSNQTLYKYKELWHPDHMPAVAVSEEVKLQEVGAEIPETLTSCPIHTPLPLRRCIWGFVLQVLTIGVEVEAIIQIQAASFQVLRSEFQQDSEFQPSSLSWSFTDSPPQVLEKSPESSLSSAPGQFK